MANLKLDLLNKIQNDKFYAEIELVRLAGDPNMNYKVKVTDMQLLLLQIATLNAELGLIEEYFKENPTQNNSAPNPVPQGTIHQGQTHGE